MPEPGGPSRELVLPAGAWLALPSDPVRAEYSAPGVAGVCDAGLAGMCRRRGGRPLGPVRHAHGLGARGRRAAHGDPLEPPGPRRSMRPRCSRRASRLLRRFSSSVVRDVRFRLRPRRRRRRLAGLRRTPRTSPRWTTTSSRSRLAFPFAVRVPALPRYRGAYLEGGLRAGGASVPGQGLVPLGLGVAVNVTPPDPQHGPGGGAARAGAGQRPHGPRARRPGGQPVPADGARHLRRVRSRTRRRAGHQQPGGGPGRAGLRPGGRHAAGSRQASSASRRAPATTSSPTAYPRPGGPPVRFVTDRS